MLLDVRFYYKKKLVQELHLPYQATFGQVSVGKPLAYLNSLLGLSFAVNQGNFANKHKIWAGNE